MAASCIGKKSADGDCVNIVDRATASPSCHQQMWSGLDEGARYRV